MISHTLGLRILLIGMAALALAGCDSLPASTPTPTRAPREEAAIYVGELEGGAGRIALIVTGTRAQAAVCSNREDNWREVNAWLGRGTNRPADADRVLGIENAAGARVAAQKEGHRKEGDFSGGYTAANGQSYRFTAGYLMDAQDVAAGTSNGVFWYDGSAPPGVQGNTLLIAIATDQFPAAVCAMLLQDGKPLSRLLVQDLWQTGFSTLIVADIAGPDGRPIVWENPGRLGQVDSIALPTPTSRP